MVRPVHIGLSPNTGGGDALSAFKLLLQPWKWRNGSSIVEIEEWLKDYFRAQTALTFNAGRSALLILLKSLELPKNSEVLIQAFTCAAVPNSIRWAGLTPVFVDIGKTLNVDTADAEKKITPQTKVLIVQHTFGIPADMEKIASFSQRHNLILIEDCAHALGAAYKGRLVGTFGDAAFFSFGRDKIVSSVFGGAVILTQNSRPKSDQPWAGKLKNYQEKLSYPSYFWILQQLLHPIISFVVLYTYNFLNLGKAILWLAQKLRLLSFPVYTQEKSGRQPSVFPKKYPNALAELLISQLKQLTEFNHVRIAHAQLFYDLLSKRLIIPKPQSGAVYLRYNLLTKYADEIRFYLKKQGIIAGNWYSHLIDPKGSDAEHAGYVWGSCPNAEKAARESLNLPTYPYITEKQIRQIGKLINQLYDAKTDH